MCACVGCLSMLVGGPMAIKPMVKVILLLLPDSVVSVIFKPKRCFSPTRDLLESGGPAQSAL